METGGLAQKTRPNAGRIRLWSAVSTGGGDLARGEQ